jgi:hypothetical protein
MAVNHFPEKCENIPLECKELINQTREDKSMAGGGRKYWSDAARAIGIFEDTQSGMLRFLPTRKKNKHKDHSTSTRNTTTTKRHKP